MRPINLLSLSVAMALLSSCGNEKKSPGTDVSTVTASNIVPVVKDTVPCANCLTTFPMDSLDKEPLYDEEISWRDFLEQLRPI
jgi:hypothetical protein